MARPAKTFEEEKPYLSPSRKEGEGVACNYFAMATPGKWQKDNVATGRLGKKQESLWV